MRGTAIDDPQLGAPVAALLIGEGSDPTMVESLAGALRRHGLDPLPISGPGPSRAAMLTAAAPDVILDGTASVRPADVDCPVLRVVFPDHGAASAGRIDFVAALAAGWARLRRTPAAERRLAVVLPDHPDPAALTAAIVTLRALAATGYRVEDVPADGTALMARLAGGAQAQEALLLPDYFAVFHSLPAALQEDVTARWGPPERDPSFHKGELHCGEFTLSALRFGNVTVGLRPGGDAGDVPRHARLAFHAWLQDGLRADAVLHMDRPDDGRPGEAVSLAAECHADAARGPLPRLWPLVTDMPGSWPAMLHDLRAAQRW